MKTARCIWYFCRPAPGRLPTRFRRPRLERLEDRLAPAAHDTLKTAILIPAVANQPTQVAIGDLTSTNEVVLYKVTLQADTALNVTVADKGLIGPYSGLRLFDSSGADVTPQGIEGLSTLSYGAFGSGTYYVGVSSAGNDSYNPNTPNSGSGGFAKGSYELSLTLTTFQPDDTLATANLVSFIPNTQVRAMGDVAFFNQADLYQVQLQADNALYVSVQGANGASMGLRLFDNSGADVTPLGIEGESTLSFGAFNSFSAGTYYVGVSSGGNDSYNPNTADSGSGGSTTASYTLTLTLTAADDTLATANPVALNDAQPVQVSNALAYANQVDLYKIPLQSGDVVVADVSNSSVNNALCCLRIFDSDGQQLEVQPNIPGTLDTQETFDAPSTGVYYVGVSSNGNLSYDPNTAGSGANGSATGYYTLSLTVVTSTPSAISENTFGGVPTNLSFNSAQTVTDSTVLQGTYVQGTTEYYRFTAPITGWLNASATPEDASVFLPRLALYSGTDQLLIQADGVASGAAAAALSQHLQPGNYYLCVSAVADSFSGNPSYVLDTTFSLAVPPFQTLSAIPTAVAVGLINGHASIVTANLIGNTVSVYLGNGDGSFQPARTYSVQDSSGQGVSPAAVAVADFNGIPYIVTANSGDNTISVLQGDGSGAFLPCQVYGTMGSSPSAIAMAELNDQLYIVAANYNSTGVNSYGVGTVAVFQTDNGVFQPTPAIYSVQDAAGAGLGPAAVALSEYNGQLVIATANQGDTTLSVLQSDNNGIFQQPASVYSLGTFGVSTDSVAMAAFQGSLYLVTADDNGTVSVFRKQGDAAFQSAGSYVTDGDSVAVGEFNDNLNIVSAGPDGTISVLQGNGGGGFQSATTYSVGYDPVAVALGDFNGDGNMDIVTAGANGPVSILLGRANGTFVSTLLASPSAMATGDFNRDGNLDLVVANSAGRIDLATGLFVGTVSVLLGNGDGTFQSAASYYVGGDQLPTDTSVDGVDTVSVAVGDFNNDGNLDLVVAIASDNSVSVLLGRGDGTFLPAVIYPVGDSPQSVAVGDFTGNGNLDIVTVNGDGTVSVLLGKGDGTFQLAETEGGFGVGLNSTTTAIANAVAVGDFTGNGNLDIVTADEGSPLGTAEGNVVSVLLGNGKGNFQAASTYDVSSQFGPYAAVAVGDLTGNGNLDIVTANGDGTVSVLLGSGDGTFQIAGSYYAGNNITSLAVGDFTHNGRLDIVTANSTDNTVSVLLGNGDGTFQSAVTYAVGTLPEAVAVGDFNNDGNLGIAAANGGDNSLSLLLGEGNGQFTDVPPQNGVAIRNIPFLQDLTGDGIPDELILNSSGELLFRQGLANGSESFTPPVIINPDNPARCHGLPDGPEFLGGRCGR